MLVQKKKNKWGCLDTSFAMVLGIPIEELHKKIGHDGGEKIGNQSEPYCRRGFHTQEIIDFCTNNGFSVTQIDCMPVLRRREGDFPLFSSREAEERLMRYLESSKGVLIGSAINDIFKRHAFANFFGKIYDPDDGKELKILPHTYLYESYYKVNVISESSLP